MNCPLYLSLERWVRLIDVTWSALSPWGLLSNNRQRYQRVVMEKVPEDELQSLESNLPFGSFFHLIGPLIVDPGLAGTSSVV